jgi:hypothetical protein
MLTLTATLCSEDWKNLSAADKGEWRARAKDAKEEHQRMYPDYKYTPRKPGQKKKRQSRKVAQAAMAANPGADLATPGTIPQASLPDMSSMPFTPIVETDAVTMDIFDNITDSMSGGAVRSIETDDVTPQQGPPFHDNEIVRQNLLDIEFGSSFDFNSFVLFGDEAYAFRDGADASITLPSFSSEMF